MQSSTPTPPGAQFPVLDLTTGPSLQSSSLRRETPVPRLYPHEKSQSPVPHPPDKTPQSPVLHPRRKSDTVRGPGVRETHVEGQDEEGDRLEERTVESQWVVKKILDVEDVETDTPLLPDSLVLVGPFTRLGLRSEVRPPGHGPSVVDRSHRAPRIHSEFRGEPWVSDRVRCRLGRQSTIRVPGLDSDLRPQTTGPTSTVGVWFRTSGLGSGNDTGLGGSTGTHTRHRGRVPRERVTRLPEPTRRTFSRR